MKLTKLPTTTVTVIDHAKVQAMLLKGPVDFDCTRDQTSSIKASMHGRGYALKVRRNQVGGEVLGYHIEVRETPIKKRTKKFDPLDMAAMPTKEKP